MKAMYMLNHISQCASKLYNRLESLEMGWSINVMHGSEADQNVFDCCKSCKHSKAILLVWIRVDGS